MSLTITREYLALRGLYGELNASEQHQLSACMATSADLFCIQYQNKKLLALIDESLLCPKISTLKNILAYSR